LWERLLSAPSLPVPVLGEQMVGEEFPKLLCGGFDSFVDFPESCSGVGVDV